MNTQKLPNFGNVRILNEHANDYWARILTHARSGMCTCHVDAAGEIHLYEGCSEGTWLVDEYNCLIKMLKTEEQQNERPHLRV